MILVFANDPIMSIRVQICIGAGESASLTFITGVCTGEKRQ